MCSNPGHVNENGEKHPFITKIGILKKTNHIQPDVVTVCSSTKPRFDVGKLRDFLKRHCVNYATESCEQKHFSDWPYGICISVSFPFRRGIFKKSWHTIYHKLVPQKSCLVSAVVAIVATWSEYVSCLLC